MAAHRLAWRAPALFLALLFAALLAPQGAAARRLQSTNLLSSLSRARQLLARRSALQVCSNCLGGSPSAPLPLPSDGLAVAAADLSWLADPFNVSGLACCQGCGAQA
jgi:hypothetical protein